MCWRVHPGTYTADSRNAASCSVEDFDGTSMHPSEIGRNPWLAFLTGEVSLNLRVGVRNTIRKSVNLCQKNGFLILNNFKMLVRFSKYDFWIPEQILDLYRKNPQKNKYFP